jgi:ABC-type thiamine transport system ATPase subunit
MDNMKDLVTRFKDGGAAVMLKSGYRMGFNGAENMTDEELIQRTKEIEAEEKQGLGQLSDTQRKTIMVALGFTRANLDTDLEEAFPWLTEAAIDEVYALIEGSKKAYDQTIGSTSHAKASVCIVEMGQRILFLGARSV